MKNILVMVGVGVALCCVTVGGLLGAQGRLNYEGTKNIPLLSAVFARPKELVDPVESASSPVDVGSPVAPAPTVERKRNFERNFERNLDRNAEREPTGAAGGLPAVHGFSAGKLFDLRRLEASGMTIGEVNALVEQVRVTKDELARERAELRQQRRDLELRERDVAARHARVAALMQQVTDARRHLERSIKDFNARVVELPADEAAAFAEIARTIAKLAPEAAAELIVEFWQTPGGQVKVVKILAVMQEDRADEILACLDTKRVREILEKRMTVIRTGAVQPVKKRGPR